MTKIYYDVYYTQDILLECGLTDFDSAQKVIQDWINECEPESEGSKIENYNIEMVVE
jgi:hypothetical protein